MAKFIVIEGCDGAGTTTQRDLLLAALGACGLDCIGTAEPTDGPIGKIIRSFLHEPWHNPNAMAMLFVADRIEHSYEIKEWIWQEKWVVCDRYYYSSIVYQSLLGNVDMEWLLRAHQNKGVMQPDITFYLKVDAETAWKRIDSRKKEKDVFEEKKTVHELIRHYDLIPELVIKNKIKFPFLNTPLVTIDGDQDPKDVCKDITKHLFRNISDKPDRALECQ